jgi:hypothetical protein
MLSAEQLARKIEALADQQVSVNDFEDWFRDNSRDVHLWGGEELNGFVDAVEALFSDRYFESLSDKDLRSRLQQEALRFPRPFALRAESSGTVILRAPDLVPALATAAAAFLLYSAVLQPLPPDMKNPMTIDRGASQTVWLIRQNV